MTRFWTGRRPGLRYSVRIKSSASKAIGKLDAKTRRRIVERIDTLAEHPTSGSRLKGEFEGLRRLREGDYRIIYELRRKEITVLVLRVGHRRDVYR